MDTVLYFGPRFDRLGLGDLEDARRDQDGSLTYIARGKASLRHARRIVGIDDLPRAVSFVRLRPVDLLLLDARGPGELDRAIRLLDVLFPHGRMGGPLLRRRILALVREGADGTQAAFALGQYGIGGALIDPSAVEIARRIDGALAARGHGKVAICLAGGGIEGLLYELGVMRALDACMADRSIVDFDFFCGISAGAILGALLANGIGPDEIARALEGRSNRLDPIGRWDLFAPNFGELGARAGHLLRSLSRGGEGPRGAISSLSRAVPTAFFSGRYLGRWLERQLARPGMSDRFGELRRPLYVGATDQDTSEAIVFGADTHPHVPVHMAVRASAALVPFYPPVPIDGRWYIDGAFSRTTNMRVAANRGATLVFLIDPLVPVRSAQAGYVRARGGIYGAAQALKGLIHGRFDKAMGAIAEMHPNVAFHLFRPEADEMRILSGSPMKYFYRREVERIAYESTLAKIRDIRAQLGRDLELHGIAMRDPSAPGRDASDHPAFAPDSIGIG